MSYKFTEDHIFKRILVFQLALTLAVVTVFFIYILFFNTEVFWVNLFFLIMIAIFGTGSYWLFKDALSKDKSKIENSLNEFSNTSGGTELLGVLILIVVYLFFGLIAFFLTFLYRLFFDMEERL